MDFLQLQYFQTVARLEHMTKAAETLSIAQPSLSKSISRLEEELGVRLFDREGRTIKLNSMGKAFLQRVDRVFMELNEGRQEVQQLAGLQEGSITLAVTISKILPELLGSFLSEYPKVHLRQVMEPAVRIKQQLESGEIDFCITSLPIEGDHLIWEPLMTEEIFLLVPQDHPLSFRSSISLSEVREDRFISLNSGYGFRRLTDEFCRKAGFMPNTAFEGDEPAVIGSLVNKGLGVAFVPAMSVADIVLHSTSRLRISSPECRRTIGLVYSDRTYKSMAAQRFHVYCREYFKQLFIDLQKL
ncbi:LysR family transcriptional regulator [Paenibacillus physcomitrellae]|uniref:LysR family transcriptional regulator n=1 Tax=Paenibacillus physcomitrellae TaxID=1619311 RepID=A0ABQ1GAZ8_9BACL|nr:LysR substrate-binding domain-containing protein [Paenibacillus physcomitrellae]GGA40171.1 LysR family transcriptional regulator [Paenibacillus physcomitrellae]